LEFFRKHIIAGIGLLVGPAIFIGSLVLHGTALHEMGLPVEIWEAIGGGIFFLVRNRHFDAMGSRTPAIIASLRFTV
jgi:hypothetical protein